MSDRDDPALDALIAEGADLQAAIGTEPLRRRDLSKPKEKRARRRPRPLRRTELDEPDEPEASEGDAVSDDPEAPIGGTVYLRSGPGGPRSSGDLERPFIDPVDMPFTPRPRSDRSIPARALSASVFIVIAVLIGAVVGPQIMDRFGSLHELRYKDGILTATPTPLSPLRPAVVEQVYIDPDTLPDEPIEQGAPIAQLSTSELGPNGETWDLRAPFDARFVSIDTPPGGVTLPGTPVATVYDPTDMHVIITVQPRDLDNLRQGMTATMRSGQIEEPITGVVTSAVPLLGTDQEPTPTKLINVRIRPDEDAIENLVPGIRFRVSIDTHSVPDEAPPLVFVGPSDEDPPEVIPAEE